MKYILRIITFLYLFFYSSVLDHGATVIQRRTDGSVNFDQSWEKYENGFGDFQGERHYCLLFLKLNYYKF